MKTRHSIILSIAFALSVFAAHAEDKILTVAVFDFESTDKAVSDLGPKVATLLNANLSADPRIITVERAELEKALGEQEMGLSGTIKPETAAKVGNLTGAKVLITGRVFTVDRDVMIVAKIIGTETGRVYGEVEKASGTSSLSDSASSLAKKIANTIAKKADTLVAMVEKPEDRIEKIREALKGKKLPVIEVHIAERHFGGLTIDPAAQTAMS